MKNLFPIATILLGVIMAYSNPPLPILFVHGINSDAKMWGQVPLNGSIEQVGRTHAYMNGCEDDCATTIPFCIPNLRSPNGDCLTGDQAWGYYCDAGWSLQGDNCVKYWSTSLNLTSAYKEGSTADYFATNFNCSRSSSGINHNGLYFYNSLNRAGKLAPFTALHENFDAYYNADGQTLQLKERVKEVLDDYFGSAWVGDPTKKIIIVAHSQGGLITRNAIRVYSDVGVQNPMNHIARIVTIGTPHTGSQWARESPTVDPLLMLKKTGVVLDALGKKLFEWLPFSNPVAPITTGFLRGSEYLDGTLPYLQTLNASGFPKNHHTGQYIPLTALYGTTPGMGGKLYASIKEGVYQSCLDGAISYGLLGIDGILMAADYKLDWFTVQGCGTGPQAIQCKQQKCITLTNNTVSKMIPLLQSFDDNWSKNSDFIVEVGSQKWDNLSPKPSVFKTAPVAKSIVPHSTILTYLGEGAQAKDLYDAVVSGAKSTNMGPILSLLLQ